MATIIDQFLIELGLDASKFSDAQTKVVDSLRKLDEEQQKTNQNMQDGGKKSSEAVGGLSKSLAAFSAVSTVVKGITADAFNLANNNAMLQQQADLLGVASDRLNAYKQAIQGTAGASGDDIVNTLHNIKAAQAHMQMGDGQGSDVMNGMAMIGMDFKNFTGSDQDWQQMSANLIKKSKETNEEVAFARAQKAGVTEGLFHWLMKGPEEVARDLADAKKRAGYKEGAGKDAEGLLEHVNRLKEDKEGIDQSKLALVLPMMDKAVLYADKLALDIKNVNDETNGWLGLLTEVGVALGEIYVSTKLLKSFAPEAVGGGAEAAAAEAAAAGGGGAEVAAAAEAAAAAAVARATAAARLAASRGLTALEIFGRGVNFAGLLLTPSAIGADPSELAYAQLSPAERHAEDLARTGHTRSKTRGWRNNNPGDLKYGPFARRMGATGTDGTFAIFLTAKAGENAMNSLFRSYKAEGKDTISSIIYKYAPPTANKTEAYISYVTKQTGIDRNTHLTTDAQYSALQKSMSMLESGPEYPDQIKAGAATPQTHTTNTSSSQVNIDTMHINTQATDADGISKDIQRSMEANRLINFGTMGQN